MSTEDGSAGLEVSGIWHGRYSFPRDLPPNSFTATLSETGGWITGAIEEIAQAGPNPGHTIGATVQGRRDGAQVRFLKTYDLVGRGYDSVVYDGELSEDGTEISGRWSIPGNWSGTFLMIRAQAPSQAVARERSESTPAR